MSPGTAVAFPRQSPTCHHIPRDDWGVGSDLDLVAVVESSDQPFTERPLNWDLMGLPVPAEILVYTSDEWEAVLQHGDRFARVMAEELFWLVGEDPDITR